MEQLKARLNASANIWEKYFGIELCFFVHVLCAVIFDKTL